MPTFGRMPAWCSFAVHHMWHHLPRTFPNRALQWLCFLAERIRPINAQRRCDNEWSTWFSARGEEEPSGHIRIPTSTWLGWWRGACCSTEAPQDCKCFRSQQATYEINNRNNKLGTGSGHATRCASVCDGSRKRRKPSERRLLAGCQYPRSLSRVGPVSTGCSCKFYT